jgi:hypothetical protein
MAVSLLSRFVADLDPNDEQVLARLLSVANALAGEELRQGRQHVVEGGIVDRVAQREEHTAFHDDVGLR